jgi:hypothetical protein
LPNYCRWKRLGRRGPGGGGGAGGGGAWSRRRQHGGGARHRVHISATSSTCSSSVVEVHGADGASMEEERGTGVVEEERGTGVEEERGADVEAHAEDAEEGM